MSNARPMAQAGCRSRPCLLLSLDAMNFPFRWSVPPWRGIALAILASADRSYSDCTAILEEAANFEMRALGGARKAMSAFGKLHERQEHCREPSCRTRSLGQNTEPWPSQQCGHSCSCSHKWPRALLFANTFTSSGRSIFHQWESFSWALQTRETAKPHCQDALWRISPEQNRSRFEVQSQVLGQGKLLKDEVPWAFGPCAATCGHTQDPRPGRHGGEWSCSAAAPWKNERETCEERLLSCKFDDFHCMPAQVAEAKEQQLQEGLREGSPEQEEDHFEGPGHVFCHPEFAKSAGPWTVGLFAIQRRQIKGSGLPRHSSWRCPLEQSSGKKRCRRKEVLGPLVVS